MKIQKSGAALSKIVRNGERLKRLAKESGQEYLPLNRGINQVVPIDLTEVIPQLDFASPEMLNYPPTQGLYKLRKAIGEEFFRGASSPENILITGGGMNALDLIVQTLGFQKLYLPRYYWGCYHHILTIRQKESGSYARQAELADRLEELRGNAVLICDPANPLGEKYDDEAQLDLIRRLNAERIPVIVDSPYRRIFAGREDDYYARLAELDNVIITESFSKSVGLSGQRLGFLHTTNRELMEELHVRLMYATNGINAFAQLLVHELLTGETGKRAVTEFKIRTARNIERNIEYLRERGLLAEAFYADAEPRGMFAIVSRTEEELLAHRIGSVSLSFFTDTEKERAARFSRICVSVPHEKFVQFFDPLTHCPAETPRTPNRPLP